MKMKKKQQQQQDKSNKQRDDHLTMKIPIQMYAYIIEFAVHDVLIESSTENDAIKYSRKNRIQCTL